MIAADIKTLFDAGAHFGFARARRHPSATAFLFGTKDRTDVFDLEETARRLQRAREFVSSVAASGGKVLFVGGKPEASELLKAAAMQAGMPYSAGRWIGGSLTNFKHIRKRIDRLQRLIAERESGELEKYTKRERLLIGREIEELRARFGGLVTMTELPAAVFAVDTRHERTAVDEAVQLGIPVIGFSNSDCNFSLIAHPIPGNDASARSIRLIANEIADAYLEGRKAASSKSQQVSNNAK